MRNASCFIILFHVNNQLQFPKGASESNPLLVQYDLSIYEDHNIPLCIQMHTKQLTQSHPKVITSGVKQHLSGQSLHPFRATIFILSHFGPTQEWYSTPQSSALVLVIHRFEFSTLLCLFVSTCLGEWNIMSSYQRTGRIDCQLWMNRLSLRNYQFEVQIFMKINDRFRGIYGIYLNFNP